MSLGTRLKTAYMLWMVCDEKFVSILFPGALEGSMLQSFLQRALSPIDRSASGQLALFQGGPAGS